jgi:SAM-dependent methyltransferase
MDGRGEVEELEVPGEDEVAAAVRKEMASDARLADRIGAAAAFDEIFVPALFREWAPRVAAAARIAPGERVLDVACGTGVLARAAAEIAGPSGSVTGLDIDPGMLAVAARAAPALSWREGTAQELPFADASFDAVVSQFGLMFFENRPGALREMRRVLRPGGRLAVAVWGALDDTPAYAIEADIVQRIAGEAPADALRAPFVLGDRGRLAALFAEAGIPDAVVATEPGTGRFANVRAMIEADLRGWLPLLGFRFEEPLIEEVVRAAERELAGFVAADGTVAFASPANIVTATG